MPSIIYIIDLLRFNLLFWLASNSFRSRCCCNFYPSFPEFCCLFESWSLNKPMSILSSVLSCCSISIDILIHWFIQQIIVPFFWKLKAIVEGIEVVKGLHYHNLYLDSRASNLHFTDLVDQSFLILRQVISEYVLIKRMIMTTLCICCAPYSATRNVASKLNSLR